MANLLCAKPLQGSTVRVTMLDACGNPLLTECAYAVSDGFVSVTLTPNVDEGERLYVRNSDGEPVINQRAKPNLNWYDISLIFQEVDFELFTTLTGLLPNEDDLGRTTGFLVTESRYGTGSFALEVWMGNAEEECAPGDVLPFHGYNLLPWVVEGSLSGDITITNDLITFTVTGRTRNGTSWGVGPYDVVLDTLGTPSPLFTAIPIDTHHLPIWTQLAPPAPASCGCPAALPAGLLYPALDLYPALNLYPIGA
jgi:hypothetical protein